MQSDSTTLEWVRPNHFTFIDGDRAPNSTHGSAASSVISDAQVSGRRFQFVETIRGHKADRAHVSSKSLDPDAKGDPNNILYLTPLMHNYFDGLKCIEAPRPDLQRTPRMRLRWLCTHPRTVESENRDRLDLLLEYIDGHHADSVPALILRDSSQSVTQFAYRTFVFLNDVNAFKTHLVKKWRQDEIQERWTEYRTLQNITSEEADIRNSLTPEEVAELDEFDERLSRQLSRQPQRCRGLTREGRQCYRMQMQEFCHLHTDPQV